MSLKTDIVAWLASAEDIVAGVEAGTFTVGRFEADVNALRAELSGLLVEVDATWGAAGWTLRAALEKSAVELLRLRSQVSNGQDVATETLSSPSSLIELAVRWYDDFSRWEELYTLNPELRDPAALRPGQEVRRYAQ